MKKTKTKSKKQRNRLSRKSDSYFAKNTTELRLIGRRADKGDRQSQEFLQEYNTRLVTEANRRLDELEKAGITRYAMESAMAFITSYYGSQSARYKLRVSFPRDSGKDVVSQLISVRKFLAKESSTVQGYNAIVDRQLVHLRDMMDMQGVDMTDGQLREFHKFLGSNAAIRNFITNFVESSNKAVDILRQKFINDGYNSEQMLKAINLYNENKELGIDNGMYYSNLMQYLKGTQKLSDFMKG